MSTYRIWTCVWHLSRRCQKADREWTNRDYKKHWESLTGLKQPKGLIQGPSARRTKELLKLQRNQLRWATGLLTVHCHLKGRLIQMGFTDNPTCERCSDTHILCDCEAIADLRFCHLGRYFMEPNDCHTAPVSKILHFIWSIGLLES
jgi:hypothetical protein